MERFLDKTKEPTESEIKDALGNVSEDFFRLFQTLTSLGLSSTFRFPHGNNYGWGYNFKVKGKHFCDLFPGYNGFCLMIRLTNKGFESLENLSSYALDLIANKYPCGEGGVIHYCFEKGKAYTDLEKIIYKKHEEVK